MPKYTQNPANKLSIRIGEGLQNLFTSTTSLPQVVFATPLLCVSRRLMSNLYAFEAQASTQAFCVFNRSLGNLYPLSTGLIMSITKEN